MAGKVNFSIREMGILAKILNISLDSLLYQEEDIQWLPFILETPLKFHSIDALCDMIDLNFKQIEEINQDEPGTSGNVYHSLPLEFFVHSPLIMKFMFFKWGYYFVQSDEYNNFSQWKLPPRLSAISEKYNDIYNFLHVFYIWDSSLIWALSKEISNFYKTHIISEQEKEDTKMNSNLYCRN